MTSEPIASTIVWHRGKAWRVSTINRESSAVAMYGHVYAETMVWAWNPETRDVEGDILGQFEGRRDSLMEHWRAVYELHDLGRLTGVCPKCDGSGAEWVKDRQGYLTERECPECAGSRRA